MYMYVLFTKPTHTKYHIAGKFGGDKFRGLAVSTMTANISLLHVYMYMYVYMYDDTVPDCQI